MNNDNFDNIDEMYKNLMRPQMRNFIKRVDNDHDKLNHLDDV